MTILTASQCPVCTGPSFVEHKSKDFTLFRCRDCGHCFTDLDSIDGLERYETEYFEKEHRNWFLHPNLAIYEKLSQIIREHKPSASVLDVGCGNGNFLRYLKSTGNNLSLTGIDVAHNESVPGIEYIKGDFLEGRFDRQFDVVANLMVIEHIPDVSAFSKRLHALCVPGGLAITMTVDERSLIYGASRILKLVGFSMPFKRLYSKHHVNHFTHSSLRLLLERHGLSTIQLLRHNWPMAAMDFPETSAFLGAILRTGVWGAFQAGTVTGRTIYQTIISKRAA